MYKQNLHIHTTYADGADTPEEVVLAAIAQGFDSIGFSEHSFMSFSSYPYQLHTEDYKKYRDEVFSLKEKYKGTIDIFCGMEMELFYVDNISFKLDFKIFFKTIETVIKREGAM